MKTRAHNVQLTADSRFRSALALERDYQAMATGGRPTPAQILREALPAIRLMNGAVLAAEIADLDLSVEARGGVVTVDHEDWIFAARLAQRFVRQTPGKLGVKWSARTVIIAALYYESRARLAGPKTLA